MRIVFCGTPQESVGPLRALHDAGHDVVLAVTQPDRKRGRGSQLVPSPVKKEAVDLGIPVSHKLKDILDVDADLGVVVAFGRLIKSPVLEKFTWLNLHPSLLPRWRGATPVESALLAGDERTGVCVMQLEAGMDTGPIYAVDESAIDPNETAQQLSDRLFTRGTELLLQQLAKGLDVPVPQHGEPTYAPKLSPGDFHLQWTESAEVLHRVIRLGRAWTTLRGKRFRILSATLEGGGGLQPGEIERVHVGTGRGSIQLQTVQPEGKGPQDAMSWANGARLEPGERFV